MSRENFCKTGDNYVWRKPQERGLPELEGWDKYSKQAPNSRIIPLWAGIGKDGVAAIHWHDERKTNGVDWAQIGNADQLNVSLQKTNRGRHRGAWKVLCVNESCLRAPPCLKAYRKYRVKLLKLPAKSPDLNPIEQFWAWLRNRLRKMDLNGFVKKRVALGKMAYKARVRAVLNSTTAKIIASRCYYNLQKKMAVEVVKNKGGPSRGWCAPHFHRSRL